MGLGFGFRHWGFLGLGFSFRYLGFGILGHAAPAAVCKLRIYLGLPDGVPQGLEVGASVLMEDFVLEDTFQKKVFNIEDSGAATVPKGFRICGFGGRDLSFRVPGLGVFIVPKP